MKGFLNKKGMLPLGCLLPSLALHHLQTVELKQQKREKPK
jgi:hypothetical protein